MLMRPENKTGDDTRFEKVQRKKGKERKIPTLWKDGPLVNSQSLAKFV